jgi:hypothetical protein
MDRDRFWEIIEASREKAGGDEDAQMDALAEQLRALPAEEVVSFEEHSLACSTEADRNDVYAAAAIIDGFWVSDDCFTDFLEWLIAQGRKVFEDTLRNPDSLADVVEKGAVCEFEGFGGVAMRVWEEKTGEGTMPVEATPAKAPDGPAWKDDDDLKRRFPKLWEKFYDPDG